MAVLLECMDHLLLFFMDICLLQQIKCTIYYIFSYYAGIRFNAFSDPLCWHNQQIPTYTHDFIGFISLQEAS